MSRWLKNVNALLENLDNQVEETVEEHRFNRTLTASARKGGEGDDGRAAAVEGLMQEEARGVDDVLAKRGLLGGDEDEDILGDGANDDDVGDNVGGNIDASNEEAGAADAEEQSSSVDPRIDVLDGDKTQNSEGGVDAAALEETIDFDGDSGANEDGDGSEPKKDLFADAEAVPAGDVAGARTKESTAPASANKSGATEEKGNSAPRSKPKQAPSSSGTGGAPPTPSNQTTTPAKAPAPSSAAAPTASLKELRKLRRHVLQLNSDLESAEREVDAQRQELDRAASRMERDRSRHKQEREATAASHKAELASLAAAHERTLAQTKEAHEATLAEMEERVRRAEQRRAQEGGERDAELAEALERERASVALAARLQEEKATMGERVESMTTEAARLGTRLEHATSQMELASERERNAEEQLDKALSLHARQLGVRQRRESALEQTVADLGAALVVAKGKVESALRAGIDLDGDGRFDSGGSRADEDSLDLKARLQDSQDDVETLRAQLSLERQRCSTLHVELQDLSKEQADELSGAHAKQRQYERKISDLTTLVAKLQSSLRRVGAASGGDDEEGLLDSRGDGMDARDQCSGQYSGDEKKETDHLRKQIASLSEKIFEMQTRIDAGRGEISTLKNRLRSAQLRAETAEKGLEAANQRFITEGMSGMSSADEELGLGRRRAARKRRPVRSGAVRSQRGVNKPSKVESIRSALGLHPGRFLAGSWREALASLLDAFDALAVDLGSHLRHYPVSRLAFVLYLLVLHAWAFFLLVYHAHAQGMTDHGVGPETLLRSYRHMEQVPGVVAAKAAVEQATHKIMEAAANAPEGMARAVEQAPEVVAAVAAENTP